MKPWIVMCIVAAAVLAGRWLLWAYPGMVHASADITRLLPLWSIG